MKIFKKETSETLTKSYRLTTAAIAKLEQQRETAMHAAATAETETIRAKHTDEMKNIAVELEVMQTRIKLTKNKLIDLEEAGVLKDIKNIPARTAKIEEEKRGDLYTAGKLLAQVVNIVETYQKQDDRNFICELKKPLFGEQKPAGVDVDAFNEEIEYLKAKDTPDYYWKSIQELRELKRRQKLTREMLRAEIETRITNDLKRKETSSRKAA